MKVTTYHFLRRDGSWSYGHHTAATAERLARMTGTKRIRVRVLEMSTLSEAQAIAGALPNVLSEECSEYEISKGAA